MGDQGFDRYDSLVFLLGRDGLLPSDAHLVFFNQTRGPDDCVVSIMEEYEGGMGSGLRLMEDWVATDTRDPWMLIDLNAISKEVETLEVIFDVVHTVGMGFSCFKWFKVSLHDAASRSMIVEFDFLKHVSDSDCATVGKIERDGDDWYFRTVAETHEGLQSLVSQRLMSTSLD